MKDLFDRCSKCIRSISKKFAGIEDESEGALAKIRFEVTNILIISKAMIIEGYFQNDGNRSARVTNLKLDIKLVDDSQKEIWHGIVSSREISEVLIEPNDLNHHILTLLDDEIPEIKSRFNWLVNCETSQE